MSTESQSLDTIEAYLSWQRSAGEVVWDSFVLRLTRNRLLSSMHLLRLGNDRAIRRSRLGLRLSSLCFWIYFTRIYSQSCLQYAVPTSASLLAPSLNPSRQTC